MKNTILTLFAAMIPGFLAIVVPVQANDAATTVRTTIQSELGVFVYPKGEQDAATQAKDTVKCYDSAKTKTGIDLKAPPPATEAPEQQKGGAVKGAA